MVKIYFKFRVLFSSHSLKNKKALVYLQDKLGGWFDKGDDLRFYQLCINCRKRLCNF
jgi:hypothetical protein